MQQITNIRKLMGFLLLACIVQACHSATVAPANAAGIPSQPLMCYVCENCAKITKQTPLEACDADYFDKSSTIQDSTTAEPSTTTVESTTTTLITTTTIMPTTTIAPTTTTSVGSTEMATTEGTTTEAVPTAPTVGPTVTVPTPPNVPIIADMLEVTTSSNNNTESTTAVNNEAPKALQLVAGNYTYHCYSVQKKVNGVEQMERGCTRVTTMESVCNHLNVLNNGTELSKCVPCSNNSCNGSSALGVSLAALLFTLIAALLSRQ